MPEVYITSRKNRLKVYDRSSITKTEKDLPSINTKSNVFLKDEQEFEIEVFNPTSDVLGVKVELNGDVISNSLVVIRPGQRVYLERFIDEAKKFVFRSYLIDKSKDAKDATKNNGDLVISFYRETKTTPVYVNPNYIYNPTITVYPNYVWHSPTAGTVYCASGSSGTCTNTISGLASYTTTTNNASGTLSTNFFEMQNLNETTSNTSNSIETGRVEKGAHSSQTFESYYGSFSPWPFFTSTIKLLPESHKPIDVAAIREYCTGCGKRKRHSADRFCGACGTKY